jgi:HSP20 family molecular chaperone IbpA
MVLSNKLFALPLVAAVIATSTDFANARNGGNLAPRNYQYSRRPYTNNSPSRTRRADPFDLMSDMLTLPVFHTRYVDAMSTRSSPRYHVVEDDETGVIDLIMELPGVQAKDLTIELEDDRLLRISGSRKYPHGAEQMDFEQTFELNSGLDASQLEVSLSNGILLVRAPKKQTLFKRLSVRVPTTDDDAFKSPSAGVTTTISPVENEAKEQVEVVDGLKISEE